MTHPTFICLGAQKAGTDWVYDQFGSHEDFWMHPIKEIAFFDTNFGARRIAKAERQLGWRLEKHGKGAADYTHEISFLLRMLHGKSKPWNGDFRAYFNLFENKPGKTYDCTPGYCRIDLGMAEKMYKGMPDTKFMLCVRDPVDRLWSQSLMHVRLKRGPHHPTESLDAFREFADHKASKSLSFLSQAIKIWQAVDTEKRFKVFNFDGLKADADKYRNSMARFVGANPKKFGLEANFNKKSKQPGKTNIPDEYRVWAAKYFDEEYKKLAQLMGGSAVDWKKNNDTYL